MLAGDRGKGTAASPEQLHAACRANTRNMLMTARRVDAAMKKNSIKSLIFLI
jgi:hypothetical protein